MRKLSLIFPQNKKGNINTKTVKNVNNFVRCLHEFKKPLPQFKDFEGEALSYVENSILCKSSE